jgi:hypothetical protein
VRKKLKDQLSRSLFERLKPGFPGVRKLDPKAGEFNGSFGFSLGNLSGRNYFVTVIAHDEQDTFRVMVAWGEGPQYPTSPFRDLRAGLSQYLAASSAEIQLAQLAGESVPYEFALDPEAQAGAKAREAIAQRLQRGEAVSPEEWLLTVQASRCDIETALAQVDIASETIARALQKHLPAGAPANAG